MANNTVKIAVYGRPAVELDGKLAVATTNDTVLPGFLMARIDDGTGKPVYFPHGAVEGPAPKLFAVENLYFGKGIDDYYKPASNPSDDKVYMIYARPGDVIWAFVAAGETLVIGSPLFSDGNGNLAIGLATPITTAGAMVGTSLETITTAVATRVKVEIV